MGVKDKIAEGVDRALGGRTPEGTDIAVAAAVATGASMLTATTPLGLIAGAVATSRVLRRLEANRRAAVIEQRRKAVGITQAEAAERAGVSLRTWSQLESSTRPGNPSAATLESVARALDLPEVVPAPASDRPEDIEAALNGSGRSPDPRAVVIAEKLDRLTPAQLTAVGAMVDQLLLTAPSRDEAGAGSGG